MRVSGFATLILFAAIHLAQCSKLILQKCCPKSFAYNFTSKKCEAFKDKSFYDWIPVQLKRQQLISQFKKLSPSLREFDFKYEPCAAFMANVSSPVKIDPTANLKLAPGANSIFAINQTYQQWCLDAVLSEKSRQWVLLSCPCLHEVCIARCCYSEHRLHIKKATGKSFLKICEDEGSSWSPETATDLKMNRNALKPWFFRSLTIYEYLENCFIGVRKDYGKTRRPKLVTNFEIDEVGTLKSKKYTANRWSYCIAEAKVQGEFRSVAMYCDRSEFNISFDDAITQSLLAAIGAFFTLLTLVIHAISHDLRQGIKGLSLIAHCACMLGAYLTMAFRPLAWSQQTEACTILGTFTHFFLLSSFFWLNVRAIIIHATFRSWDSMLSGLSLQNRSFPFYAIYALGVPALISAFMAWAQFTDDNNLPWWVVWPDMDEASCWFRSSLGRALYFSLPMGIVLTTNIYLFITTVIKIRSFKKQNQVVLNADDSQRSNVKENIKFDMEKLKLFAKLSLLMGLTYISEFMAWFNYAFSFYWYASNVAIALRAILIFVVFCCKRKVWISLMRQYPWLEKLLPTSCCRKQQPDVQPHKFENKESSTASSKLGGTSGAYSNEAMEMMEND
ncbi:G-protein coupled receptor Mth-like [Neocloeon triangulifer]|uniref:G-protein coupled receptor Mth-like n=1 Tax=Neocloeon triangulifer TaxID=2078957 RepID=UPI00286F3B08|nr:G-protein coupled receptor Mth-like [Neocloeon triangulifer]